jgi:hypothetical protein
MATTVHYVPANWNEYTITTDGVPYNGTLTAAWVTAPGEPPNSRTVTVTNGIPQTVSTTSHLDGDYQVMYTLNDAVVPPYTSEVFTVPDTVYPQNVPNPLNYGGYKEINYTIQGDPPCPIDLYVNGTKQDTITASGGVLTYSGMVSNVKIMIMDNIIYESNPTGNVTKTFNLEKAGRQLNLADFSISAVGITNNTGKGLPEINIHSV